MDNLFMSSEDAQTLERFFQQENGRRLPLEPSEFSYQIGERIYHEYRTYCNKNPDSWDAPFEKLITEETHYFLSNQGFKRDGNIFVGMNDEIYAQARNAILHALVWKAVREMNPVLAATYRLFTSLKEYISMNAREEIRPPIE